MPEENGWPRHGFASAFLQLPLRTRNCRQFEMPGVHQAGWDTFQSHGDEFFHADYPVPDSIKDDAPAGELTVKFRAHEGSVAGGVYDVRLMRGEE